MLERVPAMARYGDRLHRPLFTRRRKECASVKPITLGASGDELQSGERWTFSRPVPAGGDCRSEWRLTGSQRVGPDHRPACHRDAVQHEAAGRSGSSGNDKVQVIRIADRGNKCLVIVQLDLEWPARRAGCAAPDAPSLDLPKAPAGAFHQ